MVGGFKIIKINLLILRNQLIRIFRMQQNDKIFALKNMHLSQNPLKVPDFRKQKSQSKSKMLKTRHTHSHKQILKPLQSSINKIYSSINYQPKTSNCLIKEKYYTPAIKQYERSDANLITQCISKNFDDFERQTMQLYQFVAFYTIKQHLITYQAGIKQRLKEKLRNLQSFKISDFLANRSIFHFHGDIFYILSNRSLKLKCLRYQKNQLKTQKGSSIKNKEKKNCIKMKSKQKNMDNLLKGIMNDKDIEKQQNLKKIKKTQNILTPRKTHVLSKDSQDLNLLLKELNNLLKTHGIEKQNQNYTDQLVPVESHLQLPTYSALSTMSTFFPEKSKIKQTKDRAKNNEFAEIIQSQMSHISAIKSSEIHNYSDQYEFYGLSSLKQKQMKKKHEHSTKNQSILGNQEISSSKSRLTNKRISTKLQISHVFSQQTPKRFTLRPSQQQEKESSHKKSKSRSKTLKKGLNEKSKNKSLTSTQKSLGKDVPSTGINFKPVKKLTHTKEITNLSQRLLFMEPTDQKQVRRSPLIRFTKSPNQKKQSKSKSKGKLLISKK